MLGGQINWIQSVYVEAHARKKGVFRALYSKIVEDAKQVPDVKCVRLYVEKENETAINVYEKLGMSRLDTFDFDEIDFVFSH